MTLQILFCRRQGVLGVQSQIVVYRVLITTGIDVLLHLDVMQLVVLYHHRGICSDVVALVLLPK